MNNNPYLQEDPPKNPYEEEKPEVKEVVKVEELPLNPYGPP